MGKSKWCVSFLSGIYTNIRQFTMHQWVLNVAVYWLALLFISIVNNTIFQLSIVVPTKSDSDIVFCLQLLSQILTCTPHLR